MNFLKKLFGKKQPKINIGGMSGGKIQIGGGKPGRMPAVDRQDLDYISDCKASLLEEKMHWTNIIPIVLILFLTAFIGWAAFAEIDEITKGHGKVIPTSSMQVIQSLEGGILEEMHVREGDEVKEGMPLLKIDDTRFVATLEEAQAQIELLEARTVRLEAEIAGLDRVDFPAFIVKQRPDLVASELQQFESSQTGYNERLQMFNKELRLAKKIYSMNEPLLKDGVISEVELINMERSITDIESSISKHVYDMRNAKLEELNQARGKLDGFKEMRAWHEDRVERTLVLAPMDGTVNRVNIRTIGGVIQPGEPIMEIVPTGDTLLVQANITPSNIAFVHPGQDVVVKITAYDFSIYGGLEGVVEHISADTITDEKGDSYYQVNVRTEKAHLARDDDDDLPIIPGMVAEVDVITGKKTILEYLMKPLIKAKNNALTER